MNLWKVSEGYAVLLEDEVICHDGFMADQPDIDWINEVLVCAETKENALELAEAYDAGGYEPDNLYWKGRTVKALKEYE